LWETINAANRAELFGHLRRVIGMDAATWSCRVQMQLQGALYSATHHSN
jgi:hypothetical protein